MTTTTQYLTAEQAIGRIAAVCGQRRHIVDGEWMIRAGEIVDILDQLAPPAPVPCAHVRATNSDNGYITCEDCGDWLGVWKIR